MGQYQVRYLWYGQMSPAQMLFEQMSPWQLAYVKDGPRNLLLKFGQKQLSTSWDIPDMDECNMNKCCLYKSYSDTWNLFKMVTGTYV